jgi:hypothetical protein
VINICIIEYAICNLKKRNVKELSLNTFIILKGGDTGDMDENYRQAAFRHHSRASSAYGCGDQFGQQGSAYRMG